MVSITGVGMGFNVRTWGNPVLLVSIKLSAMAVFHMQLQCVLEVLPKTSLFS